MVAAKLCLRWGIADVYKWLDEVEASILDFWVAFDSVEPIGDEYRQTAELRLGLMQLLSVNYAANGVKVDMPTDWRDLMPERYVYESEKSTPTVVRAQEEENPQKAEVKRVGAMLGFKM